MTQSRTWPVRKAEEWELIDWRSVYRNVWLDVLCRYAGLLQGPSSPRFYDANEKQSKVNLTLISFTQLYVKRKHSICWWQLAGKTGECRAKHILHRSPIRSWAGEKAINFNPPARNAADIRAQALCERGGGRPGPPSLKDPMVSVDIKQHWKKKKLLISVHRRGGVI